jgi:opacity protein-like surface antigen
MKKSLLVIASLIGFSQAQQFEVVAQYGVGIRNAESASTNESAKEVRNRMNKGLSFGTSGYYLLKDGKVGVGLNVLHYTANNVDEDFANVAGMKYDKVHYKANESVLFVGPTFMQRSGTFESAVRFFYQVGLGYTQITGEVETSVGTDGAKASIDESTLGFQLGAGMDIAITHGVSLTVNTNYLAATKDAANIKLSTGQSIEEKDYPMGFINVLAGLKYQF